MMYFIFFINFLEVFLFSSFIAYFFNLNKKIRYIVLVGTINYIITNLSSIYSYDGVFLTISIIFITVIGLILETKTLNFEILFIPIIYNILILICSTLSVWIITNIFSISSSEIFANNMMFYLACILSKLLQFFSSIFFYIIIKKNNITLRLREWWIVIITELSMIISIALCLYSLNFEKLNLTLIRVLLFLLILSNVLFFFVILISNKNYDEKMKNASKLLEYSFNKQKYETFDHIKKETEILNHRMFYILWQIEWLAEKKDIVQIKSTVQKYKKLLNKNQYVINSGNDIFDCLLSLKLSKSFDNGTDLKVSIAIQKNEFYNSLEFINDLNNLIDIIIIDNNYIDLSMLEINSFLVLNINIIEYKNKYNDLENAINQLSIKYNAKSNINIDNNNYNIKVSIPIIEEI